MHAGKHSQRTLGRLLLAATAASLTLLAFARAQPISDWRAYRRSDGMAESSCESVCIGMNGRVLVAHRGAISELDGFSITNYPAPAGPFRASETPSGQLWAMTRNGLDELRNNAWIVYPLAQLEIPADAAGAIPQFFPTRQGRVTFIAASGLMELNSEDVANPKLRQLRASAESAIGAFLGVCSVRDGVMWISGSNGLATVTGSPRNVVTDSEWREFVAPESFCARNFRRPFENADNGIVCIADAVTNDQRLVIEFENERWTALPAGTWKITAAWRAREVLWAITDTSLLVWDDARRMFRETDEVSARRYFDVAVAADGTFWLATSEGLFESVMPLWSIPPALRGDNAEVDSLAADSRGRLWFIAGDELQCFDAGTHRRYRLPERLAQNSLAARSLFASGNGKLLLTSGNVWFEFRPEGGSFYPVLPPDDVVRRNPLGYLEDGLFYYQAFTNTGGRDYRLLCYDGVNSHPARFGSPQAELEGNLRTIYRAHNGDVWVGSDRGVARFHDGKWTGFTAPGTFAPQDAVAFAGSGEKLWCAGTDRIYSYDGSEWIVARGGFDRINTILHSSDDSLWVATDGGLHRFYQGAWIENGMEDGLPSPIVRGLCEDSRGRLWAGTARGVCGYSPGADSDAPRVTVTRLTEKEGDIPEGGTITLALVGRDKWKRTSPGRLLFSYRLDQHEWSPFLDANSVSYTDLPPGKHYFQARAMDHNGNISTTPAKIEFSVVLLWYHETRLMMIGLIGLGVALFFASLSYNRHRKLVRSHAEVERKVAERTRELELANRELLHSQKMTALGTLAAGIAHDFNNILSIIKGSAQIIEDNVENPEKIHTRVDRIKTVVEQGSGVVNAMLGFSRESDGAPAPCDINQVVTDTITLLGDRFHRTVEVAFQPAKNLPQVRASKDFIQQILLNFIFNAAEAMTENKRIVITAERANALPPGIVLPPAASGETVRVSVRDFGSGIPAENLPRIFEPFFTTKAMSTRRGTGLGLSMVYEMAKKIGAGIAVESVVNQGSTFTLILPMS